MRILVSSAMALFCLLPYQRALAQGSVWGWGANDVGQLGDGTNIDRYTPAAVSGLTGVIAIAGGNAHSLALESDGTVRAWGYNPYGQLGNGMNLNSNTPVVVSALTG